MANKRPVTAILPTAATMSGICLTVISIIRLTEMTHRFSSITDDLLAFDSLLFLASAILSYLAMRGDQATERLEHVADLLFLAGMMFMVVCTFLFVYALDRG